MRILNHDYAGHPFQVELSRALAARGHEVLHTYSASNQTPHGELLRREDDAESFEIRGISLNKPFQKHSYFQRRRQEIEYGHLLATEVRVWKPTLVLSGNTPTETQRIIQGAARVGDAKFVSWVQDVYSVGVHKILRRKLPVVGSLIGHWYMQLDRKALQRSDAVILISEDFEPLMRRWHVDPDRLHVIHNWAPLESVPVLPQDNPWSREMGLAGKLCFLYSGTLGMKHNPDLLLQLALRYRDREDVRVIVVSEGPGPEWLRAQARQAGLTNLQILPWQPMKILPEVLASAVVLVAVLEPDAGVFSVPSKVLTYLCAGRPLLLAVPRENLAARIVERNVAGVVAGPGEMEVFLESADRLLLDAPFRQTLSHNARGYADSHFDIHRITEQFEAVFQAAGCKQ